MMRQLPILSIMIGGGCPEAPVDYGGLPVLGQTGRVGSLASFLQLPTLAEGLHRLLALGAQTPCPRDSRETTVDCFFPLTAFWGFASYCALADGNIERRAEEN
jgi:hypothetical protein